MKKLLAILRCLLKGHDFQESVVRTYGNIYTLTLECRDCGAKRVREKE